MIQRFGNLSKEVLTTMIHKTVKENFPQKYKIKEKQKSAIITALQGYDTFIQMPTGSGKSLCYQLTSLLDEGVTIVFSPLLSLIRDQMVKLQGVDVTELIKRFRQTQERSNTTKIPIMALTACDSRDERGKINKILGMDKDCSRQLLFKSIKQRKNLQYQVLDKRKYPSGVGIIYCLTRLECVKLAKLFGDLARPYYAKMSEKRRQINQDKWMNGKIRLLCATTAFGMGIDKENVRFVVHYSIPRSLMDFTQESGRAGRDGEPSECVLLYDFNDQFRILREIKEGFESTSFKQIKLNNLLKVLNYCEKYCDDYNKNKEESSSILPPNGFAKIKNLIEPFNEKEINIVCIILEKIDQIGNVKLKNLFQFFEQQNYYNEINYEKIIRKIILCGYLRISLLTNSFKRPLPLLSISLKGFALLEQFKILIESKEEFIKLNKELEVYLIKNNNEIEEEEGKEEELAIKLTNNLDFIKKIKYIHITCEVIIQKKIVKCIQMSKDGDNVLNFEKAMSQFSAMFPDLENQLIESVLRTNDGNVEETIEKLLELGCTTASTSGSDKVSKRNEIGNEPSRAEDGQPSSRDPCADDEKIALLIQNREFLSYLRHDPNFQKAIIGRHQASAKNAHHYPLPHGPPIDDLDDLARERSLLQIDILKADLEYKKVLIFEKKTALGLPASIECEGHIIANDALQSRGQMQAILYKDSGNNIENTQDIFDYN
uniref:DNA 3'-5' helicase n=1 Tax=Meloidogyne javanica TaxID=6303 RepID=A0A915N9X2_MELJA